MIYRRSYYVMNASKVVGELLTDKWSAEFSEMSVIPIGTVLVVGEHTACQIWEAIQAAGIRKQDAEEITPVVPIPDKQAILLEAKALSYTYHKQIQGFKSKHGPLREFLKKEAFSFEESGNTRTTLYFDRTSNKLVAYCSLKCACLQLKGHGIESLCPSVEVAALCVDERYRYKGIGESIIRDAINRACEVRRTTGVQLITLFAVPAAVSFYSGLGFQKIAGDSHILQAPSHKGCIPMYFALPRVSGA